MPEIVFKGKEYVYNHHLTVPYPDFVFARLSGDGQQKLVVLETKGLYLAGSTDTDYKMLLLQRLTDAFADESLLSAGGLELVGQAESVVCDLVFEGDWRGTLNARQFGVPTLDAT